MRAEIVNRYLSGEGEMRNSIVLCTAKWGGEGREDSVEHQININLRSSPLVNPWATHGFTMGYPWHQPQVDIYLMLDGIFSTFSSLFNVNIKIYV